MAGGLSGSVFSTIKRHHAALFSYMILRYAAQAATQDV